MFCQVQQARDAYEKRQQDLQKHEKIGSNAEKYNVSLDDIKEMDTFIASIESKPTVPRLTKDEMKIYNKFMKFATDVKGDATYIGRKTAIKNLTQRKTDIDEFVKRNQPKQQFPDFKQRDYVPLDERTITMADLTNNSSADAAATPSSGLNFSLKNDSDLCVCIILCWALIVSCLGR